MVVLNEVSRFHLVQLALKHTKNAPKNAAQMNEVCKDMLVKHKKYSVENMEDIPEVSSTCELQRRVCSAAAG